MKLPFLHHPCICIKDFYQLLFGRNNETNDWPINHRPSCPYNDVEHIFQHLFQEMRKDGEDDNVPFCNLKLTLRQF